MSSIIGGISIILGSLFIGFIAIFGILIWLKSHRLRILDTTDGGKAYIRDFWVIEKQDKDTNQLYWNNPPLFPRIKIERPPMEVINTGKRGRLYAMAKVLTENGDGTYELLFLKDNSKEATIKPMKNGQVCEETFKPFSTTSKAFIMNQFKKSVERKSKRWDLQKITSIATIGMFGLCFLLAIIFLPDILEAVRGNRQVDLQIIEAQTQLTNKMEGISNNLALITKVTGDLLNQDLQGLKVNAQIVQSVTPSGSGSNVIITQNETQPIR